MISLFLIFFLINFITTVPLLCMKYCQRPVWPAPLSRLLLQVARLLQFHILDATAVEENQADYSQKTKHIHQPSTTICLPVSRLLSTEYRVHFTPCVHCAQFVVLQILNGQNCSTRKQTPFCSVLFYKSTSLEHTYVKMG